MARGPGRKIYRASVSDRKKKTRRTVRTVVIMIVLAAVVFLGYCVARSVFEYISDHSDGSATALPWTRPSLPDDDTDIDRPAENVPEDDEPENESKTESGRFSAYRLTVSALESEDALTEELLFAKESGYTAVIAVLKDQGGKIYYDTGSELAKSDSTAVAGEMQAARICGMIKAAGFTPIAQINLLEDNNRYGENRDGSYHFASDNSTWLDNSPANGGKPWLSPFDTNTQSFAAVLSEEAASAGFENIIFDGLTFPYFRNSDLNHIGAIVQSPDRYKALVNIENIAAEAAVRNNAVPIVMVSAGEILDGTSEVFKPSELRAEMIAVSYHPDEISGTVLINGQEIALSDLTAYQAAETILAEIQRLAGSDKTIIPVLKQSELDQADLDDIVSASLALGLGSYIIM